MTISSPGLLDSAPTANTPPAHLDVIAGRTAPKKYLLAAPERPFSIPYPLGIRSFWVVPLSLASSTTATQPSFASHVPHNAGEKAQIHRKFFNRAHPISPASLAHRRYLQAWPPSSHLLTPLTQGNSASPCIASSINLLVGRQSFKDIHYDYIAAQSHKTVEHDIQQNSSSCPFRFLRVRCPNWICRAKSYLPPHLTYKNTTPPPLSYIKYLWFRAACQHLPQ